MVFGVFSAIPFSSVAEKEPEEPEPTVFGEPGDSCYELEDGIYQLDEDDTIALFLYRPSRY